MSYTCYVGYILPHRGVIGQVQFSTYNDSAVRLAVDLVNTRDPIERIDELTSVEELESFLAAHETDRDGEGRPTGIPTDQDLRAVRRLREELRAVFESGDEGDAAALLNGILARVGAVPQISLHSESPHLHVEPRTGSTAGWLGAVTAMGLSVVLCEAGLDRFGSCSSHDCVDVFVDGSKNRSRRHCSGTCATRDNVAAYRERQRRSQPG